VISSEQVDKIIPALVSALAELTDVGKGRKAKIAMKGGGEYSYTYADLHDVLEAVRPKLKANGLVVIQEPFTENGGTAVSTTFVHTSGQWIESRPLRLPAGNDAQSHGSAITFARQVPAVRPARSGDGGRRRREGEDCPTRTAPVDPQREAAAEAFERIRRAKGTSTAE
jgi:hypothetical protein